MLIAITGNMGCGKTTAAKLFEPHGYRRIDLDQITRDHILTAPDAIETIRQKFPSAITANQVNRPALANIVFADDTARLWLESLLHPLIEKHLKETIAQNPAQQNWIVEVPLLFETNLAQNYDASITVAASEPTQLARLAQRGIPPELARPRLAKQLPLSEKIRRADHVLSNDGTPSALAAQVAAIVKILAKKV